MEDLVAERIVPRQSVVSRLDLNDLLIAVVIRLPLEFVQCVEPYDEEEGGDVSDQAKHKSDVLVPYEFVLILAVDGEAFVKAEQAAHGLNVDHRFNDCQLRRRRKLLFDGRNKRNVAEDHGGDGSDPA